MKDIRHYAIGVILRELSKYPLREMPKPRRKFELAEIFGTVSAPYMIYATLKGTGHPMMVK
jgi:hypothetical protein